MKDTIELHYGNYRIQCFWCLMHTRGKISRFLNLCCFDFDLSGGCKTVSTLREIFRTDVCAGTPKF